MAAELRSVDAIDGGFVARPRATVASVELDGEVVLYDEVTEGMHVLNPTAATVWSCFDGRSSLDDIARELSALYETDAETVRAAVVDVARDMGRLSLLQGVEGVAEPAGDEAAGAVGEPGPEPADAPRFIAEPPSY